MAKGRAHGKFTGDYDDKGVTFYLSGLSLIGYVRCCYLKKTCAFTEPPKEAHQLYVLQ